MSDVLQQEASAKPQRLFGQLVYVLGILAVSAVAAVVLLLAMVLVVWIWLRIGISIKFFGNA